MQFEAFDQRLGILHVAPNTVHVALVALRFLASVLGPCCFFEFPGFVYHVRGASHAARLFFDSPRCCVASLVARMHEIACAALHSFSMELHSCCECLSSSSVPFVSIAGTRLGPLVWPCVHLPIFTVLSRSPGRNQGGGRGRGTVRTGCPWPWRRDRRHFDGIAPGAWRNTWTHGPLWRSCTS